MRRKCFFTHSANSGSALILAPMGARQIYAVSRAAVHGGSHAAAFMGVERRSQKSSQRPLSLGRQSIRDLDFEAVELAVSRDLLPGNDGLFSGEKPRTRLAANGLRQAGVRAMTDFLVIGTGAVGFAAPDRPLLQVHSG